MRWRKKKNLESLSDKFTKDGKVLDKKEADKVKGGKKVRKDHIWIGCGGIIPQ